MATKEHLHQNLDYFTRVFMLHILTSSNLYGFDKSTFKHRKINDEIKLRNESMRARLRLSRLLPNLPSLFLAAFGSIILAWVGYLTWYDMTWWGKDIALIFFGSRTGEAISLGIGMKVIHYLLIGLTLLLSGLLKFLRKRSEAVKLHLNRLLRTRLQKEKQPLLKPPKEEHKDPSECPHHFGYLANRPENASVPQECLTCPKILECMRAR
jgi:hypothetical protein